MEYTTKNAHTPINGVCSECNQTVTVIETNHNPYLNNQDNVTIGPWDYSDAQSVTITLVYQIEDISGMPVDYMSLISNGKYIDKDGSLTDSAIKFTGQSVITTTTFTTTATTGSVVFKSGSSGNGYYGVLVEVIPNY